MSGDPQMIHATSVVIDGRALLLAGASGSGKSDLALRLIDRGAILLSDDYSLLAVHDGALFAQAAPRIAGRIEVRGIGIVERPCQAEAPVALMLALDQMPERLPDGVGRITLAGVEIPWLPLAPFEASAPIKAETAMRLYGLKDGAA
jgi:serine kinase of HPr protein (carbohydrate metabolism regulator)